MRENADQKTPSMDTFQAPISTNITLFLCLRLSISILEGGNESLTRFLIVFLAEAATGGGVL